MIFDCIRNSAIGVVLNKVVKNVINPKLDGIGIVEEISWRGKELFLRVRLNGLEDRPLELGCSRISCSPDGSSVSIGQFASNMAFAANALQSFVAGRPIAVPEGSARLAVVTAAKVLGV